MTTKKIAKKNDSLNVQSVGKAMRILNCFETSRHSDEDLSLIDIVELTGFDKSTAQRFTHTLLNEGYLNKNPKTKRYSLSVRVLDLAFSFLCSNKFVELANPILIDLCRATGERSGLTLFDGTTLIYVIRHQLRPDYYFSSLVGRRVPTCFTAGGRAILAALDEESRERIISESNFDPYTHHTITNKDQIREEIERIRTKGYGVSLEEIAYGEVGLGTALIDRSGMPVAALHLTGSLKEWDPVDFEKKYATHLLEAAQRIEMR